ncbi:hypothetical protein BN7_4187 [Wickerhamomyces ciferrii]|uniref:Zn(2)-C6 fungal-type domain-containing protein n=1 Tax=Wickerhamomyces ciferrii (strain ATCC 14091 / BCRC 22168 / CBS 111 / JCM 3599 / NBRC 0793 / NRRL Y-1031 F-60-10) TaxID=1206466 RepID=K0KTM2_WICCF|nr:uncharacterized protein BN7_4187 [Wickerhamomyces ciferrii]CCH44618.1 hypothetical protein BN7_4187 [Wickerhamomyces ciferrii]
MDIKTLRPQTVYSISCLECRRRKIKCDKASPTCGFCLSKKIHCEYPSNAKRKIINVSNGSDSENVDKDQIIKDLLQRVATLEDYLKSSPNTSISSTSSSSTNTMGLQARSELKANGGITNGNGNGSSSSNVGGKDFLEIINHIDYKLSDIARDTGLLDELALAKREFPTILHGKEADEVLLNNIIRTVSANYKAFNFFLDQKDVDLFYENFKQETLEPIHFQDSLIMLLLISICIRLKKFTCACIPIDKKENLIQEIYNEYQNRCNLKILPKDHKSLQIGLLELEFMFGLDVHKDDILLKIHEVIGMAKLIKLKNQNKKHLDEEFESCWLELVRMDSILAISFGTSPGIFEPLNSKNLPNFSNDQRRFQIAPIFINTINILQRYNFYGLNSLNEFEIHEQINRIIATKDLFFFLDLVTLYSIQLQLLFHKRDFFGYTKVLENCLVEVWRVSLNDDSHIIRNKWTLQSIFNSILLFILEYKEINNELALSLSIIICLNNLFSIDNHDPDYISNKLEKYCAKLNLEYCFELVSNFEKQNPQIFGDAKYCG